MRCRRDQNHVARGIGSEPLEELMPLVPPRAEHAGVSARMRFVDNNQFGASPEEVAPPPVGLDEVGRDDDVRIDVEQRLADGRALRAWSRCRGAPVRLRCGTCPVARPAIVRPGGAGKGRPSCGLLPDREARGRSVPPRSLFADSLRHRRSRPDRVELGRAISSGTS